MQVRVGDFDGDGKLDVVCLGSYYIDSLTVCKGNGDGTFGTPTPYTYSIPPTEIEVADMNGDGQLDLIEGQPLLQHDQRADERRHRALRRQGRFQRRAVPPTSRPADFNGDGKADLVSTSVAYYYSGGVNVQLGNGSGNASGSPPLCHRRQPGR